MEPRRAEDTAEVPRSQGGKHAASPSNVVLLHDLREIEAIWGVGEDRIYRAVARGQLRAYGRPGRRRYYSAFELMQLLGEPPNGTQPPSVKAPRQSNGVDGRQLSWPELTSTAEAA